VGLFLRTAGAVVIWLLIWAPWQYRGAALFWRCLTSALIVIAGSSFMWWWSASRPDDDGDDWPLKLGARRFLVVYLIGFAIFLIGAIVFLSWFDFTPLASDTTYGIIHATPKDSYTTLKPAAYGIMKTPWGLWWLSLNIQLLLLATSAGALGSYIHGLKSLADFLGNRTAKTSWFYFYLTRPFLGAALAVLFYAVIRGGFMAGTPADANAVNPYGVIAVCGLVGMFSDRASQKLSEVFETMFRTDDTRKDKLGSAEPSRLDPDTVPVNGTVREVTVRGANLGNTDNVRVDGIDRRPRSVNNDAVVFVLTDAEVTARRRMPVQLVPRAGPISKELILHISDLAITTNALPDANVGVNYGPVQLVAAGGSGGFTWSTLGAPPGLTVGQQTGILSGQPTGNPGTFQVLVKVKDSDGATAQTTLALTVVV
jgi:hypothetical protein